RIALSSLVLVVRRWGDRQNRADRLDPVFLALRVDERHHHFGRRSSSACAKKAEALRRISLARRSSKFSRSSSFSRCRSSVARPGRFPRSRSAWTTHLRRDSGAHPIFEAIERIAAHCESYWSPCSRTIRTARSRTSGEKLLGRPMDSILPQNGVSGKPGTVHTDPVSFWVRISISTTLAYPVCGRLPSHSQVWIKSAEPCSAKT